MCKEGNQCTKYTRLAFEQSKGGIFTVDFCSQLLLSQSEAVYYRHCFQCPYNVNCLVLSLNKNQRFKNRKT